MAGGRLLTKALHFLSPQPSPLHHLRRLSTGGNLNPSSAGNSVHHFLRGRGLADEVLAGFSSHLLDSRVGKVLPAKFDLFLSRGFSVQEAAKVLRCNVLFQNVSLLYLRRRLDTLRAIVSDDADLPRIMNRAVWTLTRDLWIQYMADNISKLRGWGVSEGKIKSLLVSQPRFFQLKPQCLDEAADRAEAEFGFRRESKMFVYAVNILSRMSKSKRESKFRVFESFGWDRSDVMTLFKLHPFFMTLAEAHLVKKLAFLMNEVGYDPSCIIKYGAMLGFSLEKRLRPRLELVNALKSKNLLAKEPCFYSIWYLIEREFMEKYVVKYIKEEPGICNAYITTVASPKQQTSALLSRSKALAV